MGSSAARGTSRAPIFVVGHPRSGTTLLRLILNEHPRIVVPPEAGIVSPLRRATRKFGDLAVEANKRAFTDRLLARTRMREWGLDLDAMRAAVLAAEPKPGAIFGALMELWLDASGKQRWGEKTPGTYRHLADVTAWFPDCQVVHIIRDGRDVAVSCLSPPFNVDHDKGNVYEVAVRWKDALRRGRRAARALGEERYLELRYEDLTADPEGVTRRLCDYLREDFDSAMLQYHRNMERNVIRGEHEIHARTRERVDGGRVERWRQEAGDDFVCAFEGIAGRELVDYGYRLSGKAPGGSQRLRILYERLRPRRIGRNYRRPAGHHDEDVA